MVLDFSIPVALSCVWNILSGQRLKTPCTVTSRAKTGSKLHHQSLPLGGRTDLSLTQAVSLGQVT